MSDEELRDSRKVNQRMQEIRHLIESINAKTCYRLIVETHLHSNAFTLNPWLKLRYDYADFQKRLVKAEKTSRERLSGVLPELRKGLPQFHPHRYLPWAIEIGEALREKVKPFALDLSFPYVVEIHAG